MQIYTVLQLQWQHAALCSKTSSQQLICANSLPVSIEIGHCYQNGNSDQPWVLLADTGLCKDFWPIWELDPGWFVLAEMVTTPLH